MLRLLFAACLSLVCCLLFAVCFLSVAVTTDCASCAITVAICFFPSFAHNNLTLHDFDRFTQREIAGKGQEGRTYAWFISTFTSDATFV